jgi:hypothetical protein
MGERRLFGILILVLCGCVSSGNRPSRDPGSTSISQHQIDLLHGLQDHGALNGKIFRGFHAYSPGCLRGTLQVRSDVPALYRVGIFKDVASYPVWLRFSTAGNHPTDENVPNFKGLGMKVMKVPGDDKLMEGEESAKTQDFTFESGPITAARTADQFLELASTTDEDFLKTLTYLAHNWGLTKTAFTRVAVTATRVLTSYLKGPWWSVTAFQYGPGGVAKFKLQGCDMPPPEKKKKSALANVLELSKLPKHYLTDELRGTLGKGPACMRLYAQFEGDPKKTPPDNATVEWKETDAPPVALADLTVDPLTPEFDSPELQSYCEQLRFNPWHAIPEFKPLGELNESRKEIYKESAKYRRASGETLRPEPADFSDFDNYKKAYKP